MTSRASANLLLRLLDALERNSLLSIEDRGALTARLYQWFGDQGRPTLDDVFGFKPQPDVRDELSRERRDQLIYRLAVQLEPEGNISQRAKAVRERLSRYSTGRWRQDRRQGRCPYRPGTVDHHLWRLMRLDSAVLSEDRLQKIIRYATPVPITTGPR